MSRPRLTIEIKANTDQQAQTLETLLLARLGAKGRTTAAQRRSVRAGQVRLLGDWLFQDWWDRDDVRDFVQTVLGRHPLARGTIIRWHQCTHEDPEPSPCIVEEILL